MNALPLSRTAILAVTAALAGAAPRAAAHPRPEIVSGHAVDGLAAGPGHLFVLAGGEVRTLDSEGRIVGRCAAFASPPRADHPPRMGVPDADEVLRAADLPDDDSTPAAEEALEDEGLGRRPRGLPLPDAGVVPRTLAARGADVWIATSSGVFRGDETGCRPAGLDRRDALLVAAAGGAVMVATEDLLFRRAIDDTSTGEEDDSFTVTAGLAERPRALAIDAAGAALVADDEGVQVVGGDGAVERILDRPTDALAVCGGEAVALADDGVYRWLPGSPPVRTGDRPPIRALGCGPSPEVRWVATGLGVWTSADAAIWAERSETLGRRVAGAATLGDRTWLALDDQLSVLDLTARTERDRLGAPPGGPVTRAGPAPISNRHLGAPALPWPWVTALFGAEQRTPARRGWEVMLLVTFPLGRIRNGQANAAALAAERIRRDEALAREQTDLEMDPAGDAETDARLDALLQEREALR
jgi:hypothetical protein